MGRVRAAIVREYGGPEVLRIEEVPSPAVGPRDVLIDVVASSVNPVDTKIRRGAMRGVIRYRLPWILGLDVSGVVAAVGAEVTRFRPGDEVYASPGHQRPGCYAEQVAIPERAIALKPRNLDHRGAAGLPLAALTAWACVMRPGLSAGQRLFVQAGAGGVGSLCIQLAKHVGAHVAATCSAPNVDLVRSLGADEVIDYRATRYEDVLRDQDGVVDLLGGEERERALRVLRPGGYMACVTGGIPEHTKRHGPTLGALVAVADGARFTISAFARRRVRVFHPVRPVDGALLQRITELVEAGALRPVIDRVFSLDEIAQAHERSESGRARGKIIVAVRDARAA